MSLLPSDPACSRCLEANGITSLLDGAPLLAELIP